MLIPILFEDASKYIKNEPQRAHSRSVSSEKDTKKERRKEAKRIWRSLTKKWYKPSFVTLGK
jgi:hypothetical protein